MEQVAWETEQVSAEEFDAIEAALASAESRLNCSPQREREEVLLRKIISGGQTGADRAGLEAGRALGLETGGTAPKGFQTSAGKDRALATTFGLKELELPQGRSVAQQYVARSMKNVDDADATVAFRLHASIGTDKTIGYCKTGKWCDYTKLLMETAVPHRPLLIIYSLSEEERDLNIYRLQQFVQEHAVRVLNVAGHRADSKMPLFGRQVKDLLVSALDGSVTNRIKLGA